MPLLNPDPNRDRLLSENRARVYLGSSMRWLDLMLRHVQVGNFTDAHYCHVTSLEDFARAGIYADAVQGTDVSSA